MQNVITCNNVTLQISNTQRPYSNNFVQQSATLRNNNIHAVVVCTANSKEPSRVYACVYNMQAQLLACCTLN